MTAEGRFIRGDGLVLPNNVSLAGAQMILAAAMRNTAPAFWFGLVVGAPSASMILADMEEPTVGVGGYARIQATRDGTGWPGLGDVGGKKYIETDYLTWTATGSGFDKPIQRVAWFGTNAVAGGNQIMSLSAPLPEPKQILASTPLAKRQFKYRLYI